MSMKASTRQVDGITIVDLSGRITLGEGSVVLRDTIKDLLGKGQKKILLNLGDVSYIDSSGIGELVSAFTSVRNQGGELKLLNLTKKVHDLLADHKAVHGIRRERRRSRRHQRIQPVRGGPQASVTISNALSNPEGRCVLAPRLAATRAVASKLAIFSLSTGQPFARGRIQH